MRKRLVLVANFTLAAALFIGGASAEPAAAPIPAEPGASEMDQEIDSIVNEITSPPELKGIAPAPAEAPDAAKPAPPAVKPSAMPRERSKAPAAPPSPDGESGAIGPKDHATPAVAPARTILARPAARKPSWPVDAAAYHVLPRGA